VNYDQECMTKGVKQEAFILEVLPTFPIIPALSNLRARETGFFVQNLFPAHSHNNPRYLMSNYRG